MAITIYTPSDNWPFNYNTNLNQLDEIDIEDLEDTNVGGHPYDHSVLEWDSSTSMWIDSGILTSVLEPVYAVWDSTCCDSGFWLSRDDRVGYEDDNYNGAQATLGSDTVWKYYFEISNFDCNIRCNSTYCRFGVGYHTNCSDPENNRQFWYYRGDGGLYDNNGSSVKSGISGIGQGDYIGFAVEVIGTTCKVWVRDGDGDWIDGDPELGTSPSFEFDTGGYEIFPVGYGVWLSYVELITKDDYFEHGRPEGFYELRTNNFSTTTTTTSTTSTTTTSTTTTTITFSTTTTTEAPPYEADWLGAWGNRIEITIDNFFIEENITNYPVPIILSSSVGQYDEDLTFIFDEIGSNSKKIAVTAGNGTSELYVEIQEWDSVGEFAVLWVSRSNWTLSATNTNRIYLYYDNSEEDNTTYVGDHGSTVAQNVWHSSYTLVAHFSESSGSILDSTSYNNDGTYYGGTRETSTPLGNGYSIPAIADRVVFPSGSEMDFTSSMSHEMLISYTKIANWQTAWEKGYDQTYSMKGFDVLRMDVNFTPYTRLQKGFPNGASGGVGDWEVLGYSFDGRYVTTYSDDYTPSTTDLGAANTIDTSTSDTIDIGSTVAFIVGEFRLSNEEKSDAWHKLNYYAWNDDLLDFGTEEFFPSTTTTAPPSIPTVSWDSANKGTYAVLSNGDMDTNVSLTATWSQAFATLGRSSGKYYFEVIHNSLGTSYNVSAGVVTSAHNKESYVGNGIDAYGWGYLSNGRYYHYGSLTSSKPTWDVDGKIAMFAVDLDNDKIWFGVDGSWDGDPAAGTGEAFSSLDSGTIYPSASGYILNGGSVTGCFHSNDLNYTPPSGFSPWDS